MASLGARMREALDAATGTTSVPLPAKRPRTTVASPRAMLRGATMLNAQRHPFSTQVLSTRAEAAPTAGFVVGVTSMGNGRKMGAIVPADVRCTYTFTYREDAPLRRAKGFHDPFKALQYFREKFAVEETKAPPPPDDSDDAAASSVIVTAPLRPRGINIAKATAAAAEAAAAASKAAVNGDAPLAMAVPADARREDRRRKRRRLEMATERKKSTALDNPDTCTCTEPCRCFDEWHRRLVREFAISKEAFDARGYHVQGEIQWHAFRRNVDGFTLGPFPIKENWKRMPGGEVKITWSRRK
jgi:hypothetical protein